MPIRLVIADSDQEYLESLSIWIQRRMPRQFEVELLTNSEILANWLDSGQKADVFILSAKDFNSLPGPFPDNTLVWEEAAGCQAHDGFPRIMKYQPASHMMKDILSICADKVQVTAGRQADHSFKTTLIVSLEGGSLFPVAPYSASALALEGKRVLFFSLEQNQATDLYFHSVNTKGLNEMLYYIKANKENLSLRLEACLSKDSATGVDFLKAPPGLLDVSQWLKEDMEALLCAIKGRGVYDEVVISSEYGSGDGFQHLMKVADRCIFSAWGSAALTYQLKKVWEDLIKRGVDADLLSERSRLLLGGSPEHVSQAELPSGLKIHRLDASYEGPLGSMGQPCCLEAMLALMRGCQNG